MNIERFYTSVYKVKESIIKEIGSIEIITEDITIFDVEHHTIGKSVGLHKLAGILIGVNFYAIAQPVNNTGGQQWQL